MRALTGLKSEIPLREAVGQRTQAPAAGLGETSDRRGQNKGA